MLAAVGIAPAIVSLNPKWSWIAGRAPAIRLISTRSMNATRPIATAGHHPNGASLDRSTLRSPPLACTGMVTVCGPGVGLVAGWVSVNGHSSARVAGCVTSMDQNRRRYTK